MIGGVLGEIAAETKKRVAREKNAVSEAQLRERIKAMPLPLAFKTALSVPGPRIIAEIKLASPSEGDLALGADPVDIARDYAANGAAALSILTEPAFFKGDISFLRRVRGEISVPLLMKDFLIDEYQILQGRANGADCVLLIAALLGEQKLKAMLETAHAVGLDALVEVHDEKEMEDALAANAELIGVNNRNLKTLEIDLDVSRRLAEHAGKRTLVCESGISTPEHIREFSELGFQGFLVGTSLIKSGRPGAALAGLLGQEPV